MNFNKIFKTLEIGDSTELVATIEKELFYVNHSGYGVYIVRNIHGERFKIIGTFPIQLKEEWMYKLTGRVEEDKRYSYEYDESNKQLYIEKYISLKPEKRDGVIGYLMTLKNIGPTRAKKIYKAFGCDAIDVLMTDPARVVAEVTRVTEKLALQWQKELKESIEGNAILIKLMDYGLTMKESEKLYKHFGDEVVECVQDNPYILIKHIRGFGFEKCDKLAMNVGIDPSSPFRLQEGILHTLKNESSQGHCYLPIGELLKKAKELLDISISYEDMSKLLAEYSKKEFIKYSIGQTVYEIPYGKVAKHHSDYQAEYYTSRKKLHRCPVLQFTEEQINTQLQELYLRQSRVYIENEDRVYLNDLYNAEVEVAERIIDLCVDTFKFKEETVLECIKEVSIEQGIVLEQKQKEACLMANLPKGGFLVLNGSAGTGKTFTLNVLLEVAKKIRYHSGMSKPKILAFAPTGKASKVAAKAIGMPCSTIHKGLGFNQEAGGFMHNEDNPFSADIIVCDETSMLDIRIAKHFLKAIKNGTKVIFMGDVKQLASVGAGNVLKDIIEAGIVPVVTLNVIKRQGEQSLIVSNANRIIEGQMIKNPDKDDPKDAFFLARHSDALIRATLIESINRIINNQNIEFDEIQVLSPQRTGSVGIYALNHLIQNAFNPYDKVKHKITIPVQTFTLRIDGEREQEVTLSFRTGDKVMNTSNNYDLKHYLKDGDGTLRLDTNDSGITNGECGVIESIEQLRVIDEETEKESTITRMIVRYDDFYAQYDDDFQNLEHSYCMTIHKSQGSAWKAVVMPISKAHTNMLDNNIIYTGWTRAREFAVAIGNAEALNRGVKRHNSKKRYTALTEKIEQLNKAC